MPSSRESLTVQSRYSEKYDVTKRQDQNCTKEKGSVAISTTATPLYTATVSGTYISSVMINSQLRVRRIGLVRISCYEQKGSNAYYVILKDYIFRSPLSSARLQTIPNLPPERLWSLRLLLFDEPLLFFIYLPFPRDKVDFLYGDYTRAIVDLITEPARNKDR